MSQEDKAKLVSNMPRHPISTNAQVQSTTSRQQSSSIQPLPSPSTAISAPDKCHFLDMPPELRNRIYALLWPAQQGRNEMVESDLLRSWVPLPAKDLLWTCRQIYNEAKLVYRAMWDETEFKICRADEEYVDVIRNLDDRRLERVSRVRIEGGKEDSEDATADCVLRDGVWTCEPLKQQVPEYGEFVLVPPSKVEKVGQMGFEVELLSGTTLYQYVEVTHMDAETVVEIKKAAGRKNLRKEELVAMVREAHFWEGRRRARKGWEEYYDF